MDHFDFDKFMSFWGEHFIMAAIWLTLTLSLNLINGFCGLFSLGHQGFWAVGAYAAGATLTFIDGGWTGFCLSFPLAIATAAIFGLIVGVPCLRLKGDYLAIATLGFSEIIRNLLQNSEKLGQSLGLSLPNVVHQHIGGGHNYYFFYLALAWGGAALTLIVLRNMIHSTHGRAIKAIRDDERAAEVLGVNLTHYKVLVFVTGAAFAGLAGAMFANFNAFISPDHFDFNKGVLMVVMVVLGGMGSFTGTIVATLLLYFIPVFLDKWLPETKLPVFYDPTQGGVVYREVKELWQVIYSLLLIVMVLVRPQGIMGTREIRWPWQARAAPPPPPPPCMPPPPAIAAASSASVS